MPHLLSTAARPARALAAGAVTARAVTVAAAVTAATALATITVARAASAGHARRDLAPPPLADAIPATLRPPGASRRPAAYVVLRPGDCVGNLDFLAIFERDGVRQRIPLAAAIALEPRSSDVAPLRATLAARGLLLPVAHADPPLARALRVLGHRSTPFLFVLDERGAVAYAADAPMTFDEMQRVAGTVSRLADEHPPAPTP